MRGLHVVFSNSQMIPVLSLLSILHAIYVCVHVCVCVCACKY
jgi:hypothetical protein